jgi:DNA polymerase III sliding clamp (beta) subunit (PCNA family)
MGSKSEKENFSFLVKEKNCSEIPNFFSESSLSLQKEKRKLEFVLSGAKVFCKQND